MIMQNIVTKYTITITIRYKNLVKNTLNSTWKNNKSLNRNH